MRTKLMAILLAAGLGLGADAAHASYTVKVKQRTLVMTGDAASDRLVLRAGARSLAVDLRGDGRTDLRVARARLRAVRVHAGAGNDTIRLAGRVPATLDGGRGNDRLIGSRGRDLLLGGRGRDTADGNGGSDRVRLGAGADRFLWQPGDGSDAVDGGNDTVTGQGDRDVLAFTGSDADEGFTATADSGSARFTSTTGNVATTLDDVEQLDLAMLGGEDELTVRDLSGTDLAALNATLGADARPDRVVVNGSEGDDVFTVTSRPPGATIAAGGRAVALDGVEPGQDRLLVNALGGNDVVSSSGLAAGVVAFTADGGPGADKLVGGPAQETLSGGDGPDDVSPGPGDDSTRLGSDEDVYRWETGDGSDSVDGEADFDVLIARGTAADEDFTLRADGPDAKLDVGTVFLGASLRNVEDIALEPLGGSNRVLLQDVSATSVQGLRVNLRDGNEDTVTVQGSLGADTIAVVPVAIGGVGQARVVGLPGDPSVIIGGGQPANDVLEVDGLAGNDRIDATALPTGTFPLSPSGDSGNDVLLGGAGAERLSGGSGADRLDGGDGPDRLLGGDGDDDLLGGPGDDVLRGGDGDDNLIGGPGADDLDGGAGNDVEVP